MLVKTHKDLSKQIRLDIVQYESCLFSSFLILTAASFEFCVFIYDIYLFFKYPFTLSNYFD